MSDPTAALENHLRRYAVSPDAITPLRALLDRLAEPHAPTAVHDPELAVQVHVADSLAGLDVPDLRAARTIADLGAGAGLPGLVLAAALPDAHVFLVESAKRKCAFLDATLQAMALRNADVACARVEEWDEGLGRCDIVCARALATLPVLCEYAAPLLRHDGLLVAWKGEVPDREAADAAAAASQLGLSAQGVKPVTPYPGSRRLALHVFRKIADTPSRYPRRPGIAVKRPLTAKALR